VGVLAKFSACTWGASTSARADTSESETPKFPLIVGYEVTFDALESWLESALRNVLDFAIFGRWIFR
jgi:hypothetical protein